MTSNSRRIGARLVLLLAVLAVAAYAVPISLGTTSSATWYITNYDGTSYTYGSVAAYASGGGNISFTSNGNSTGTMAAGLPASTSSFDGFWVAELDYTPPVGSTGVTLSFSGLSADDRAVLYVNGVAEGNTAWSPGTGCFSATDVACSSFTFTGTNIPATAAGNFSASPIALNSGLNVFTLVVNNTYAIQNSSAATRGFNGIGDGATALINMTANYTAPVSGVPEPASFTYLLLGALPLAFGFARRRSR